MGKLEISNNYYIHRNPLTLDTAKQLFHASVKYEFFSGIQLTICIANVVAIKCITLI